MSISIFTARARQPSARLKAIARYLQFSGIAGGAIVAVIAIADLFITGAAPKLPLPLPIAIVLAELGAIAVYQMGSGLLRRQRWAGYLAAFTFGAPLIRNFVSSGADLSIGAAIIPLITLGTIASVWRELGTIRDSEFSGFDDDDDDDYEPPKRNRGFGEKRALPSAPMPELSAQASIPTIGQKVVRDIEETFPRNTRS